MHNELKNKSKTQVKHFMIFNVSNFISATDMKEIMLAKDCPIDLYCLNGGTCAYYSSIGEMSCR